MMEELLPFQNLLCIQNQERGGGSSANISLAPNITTSTASPTTAETGPSNTNKGGALRPHHDPDFEADFSPSDMRCLALVSGTLTTE